MSCYKSGGCGVYEMYSCSECPASKPEYLERQRKVNMSKASKYKFADLSPCISCATKECGLVDGNECDKFKCFSEVKSKLESVDKEKANVLELFDVVKANTYKCSICGEIIFPKIVSTGNSQFNVVVNSTSIHGGLGNGIIYKKVCPNCVNNIPVAE